MPINSRETTIPTALMATIMACSQPESGTVIVEITSETSNSAPERAAAEDQICGKALYNPGTCKDAVPLKMALEVEKLLCEAAREIGNPENPHYAMSDEKGDRTDLFRKRFPKVTLPKSAENNVYQCGINPETGDGKCIIGTVKAEPGTIDTMVLDNADSVEVEGDLVKSDFSNNSMTVGILGPSLLSHEWGAPCKGEEKKGEKFTECHEPPPPPECRKPFTDFVNQVRWNIHTIVGQHARGKGKTDFVERRRQR